MEPIASGGRIEEGLDSRQIFKAIVNVDCDVRESKQLRQETTELKATLRQVELENEETHLSSGEEFACSLVEPNVQIKDGRYEILVPLKTEIF